jgi:hypothetical protein
MLSFSGLFPSRKLPEDTAWPSSVLKATIISKIKYCNGKVSYWQCFRNETILPERTSDPFFFSLSV